MIILKKYGTCKRENKYLQMNFDELSLIAEKQLDLGDFKTIEDLNDHIDSRVNKSLEGNNIATPSDPVYAVIPSSSKGNLTVFEITASDSSGDNEELVYTAKKKGQISPGGDLISSPIIKGNVVVYGIQREDGSTAGEIRSLPGGEKLPGFNVAPPRPGYTYQRVMGGKQEDDAPPSTMPTEIPDDSDQKDEPTSDIPPPVIDPNAVSPAVGAPEIDYEKIAKLGDERTKEIAKTYHKYSAKTKPGAAEGDGKKSFFERD